MSGVLVCSALLFLCLVDLTGGDGFHITLYAGEGVVSEALAPKESARHDLQGQPGQGYYLRMTVGTPPQNVSVLVDTGSSNFAIAAAPNKNINNYFNTSKSTTFKDLGTSVLVPYTQGNWKGTLCRDVVSIPAISDDSVEVNLAAISSSENFFINESHWEGILGLAYKDIARPDSSVEPFMDTFIRETNVTDTFSMQLCGTMDKGKKMDVSLGGTMVIGTIDKTLYTGDIHYALMRRRWYYEVVITDITVKGKLQVKSLGLDCKEYNFDKTIVDSGTTNLRLPNTVYVRLTEFIQTYVTIVDRPVPAGFWNGEEMLCWKKGGSPWVEFPALSISLMSTENTTLVLTVSAQQYLRQISNQLVDDQHDCYKYAISPSSTGSVIGAVVMEGFYVIFDRQNNRVGFAKSSCKNSDKASVEGPKPYHGNATQCAYNKPPAPPSTLMIVAYVMVGLCALCFLPVLFMMVHWQFTKCRHQQNGSSMGDMGSLLHEDSGR